MGLRVAQLGLTDFPPVRPAAAVLVSGEGCALNPVLGFAGQRKAPPQRGSCRSPEGNQRPGGQGDHPGAAASLRGVIAR